MINVYRAGKTTVALAIVAAAMVAAAPHDAAAVPLNVLNPSRNSNVGALDIGVNTVSVDSRGICELVSDQFLCEDFSILRYSADLPAGLQLDSLAITVDVTEALAGLLIRQDTSPFDTPQLFSRFAPADGSGELLGAPLSGPLTLGPFRLFTIDASAEGFYTYRATYAFTVSETVAPIPLPPAAALLLAGLGALGAARARRR